MLPSHLIWKHKTFILNRGDGRWAITWMDPLIENSKTPIYIYNPCAMVQIQFYSKVALLLCYYCNSRLCLWRGINAINYLQPDCQKFLQLYMINFDSLNFLVDQIWVKVRVLMKVYHILDYIKFHNEGCRGLILCKISLFTIQKQQMLMCFCCHVILLQTNSICG